MARRLNVQRLIWVLGVVVLALGVLCVWVVQKKMRPVDPTQTPASERALEQVRRQMGPRGELRYSEAGEGRALCGYAGRRGDPQAVAFVSRPNRILFSDDPLPGEFRDMRARFCPGFLVQPPAGKATP